MSLNFPRYPGTIMNNADDFKDTCSTEDHLSPSHTAWISVYPYTAPLGTFVPRCKPSLGYMDYPFSLRDVCSNALSRDILTLIYLHISDKNIASASLRNGSWHGLIRHNHTPQKVIFNSSLRYTPHGSTLSFYRFLCIVINFYTRIRLA
jgi:hypothetical protein